MLSAVAFRNSAKENLFFFFFHSNRQVVAANSIFAERALEMSTENSFDLKNMVLSMLQSGRWSRELADCTSNMSLC